MGSPVAPINNRVDFLLIGVVTLLRAGGEPLFFSQARMATPSSDIIGMPLVMKLDYCRGWCTFTVYLAKWVVVATKKSRFPGES